MSSSIISWLKIVQLGGLKKRARENMWLVMDYNTAKLMRQSTREIWFVFFRDQQIGGFLVNLCFCSLDFRYCIRMYFGSLSSNVKFPNKSVDPIRANNDLFVTSFIPFHGKTFCPTPYTIYIIYKEGLIFIIISCICLIFLHPINS